MPTSRAEGPPGVLADRRCAIPIGAVEFAEGEVASAIKLADRRPDSVGASRIKDPLRFLADRRFRHLFVELITRRLMRLRRKAEYNISVSIKRGPPKRFTHRSACPPKHSVGGERRCEV